MSVKNLSLLVCVLFQTQFVLAAPMGDLVDLSGAPAAFQHNKAKELVIFWATWCPECRQKLTRELPAKIDDPEVQIITVNTEKDLDRVRSFVAEEKIKFPVFIDPKKTLRQSLAIFSVPSWAVYARSSSDAKEVLTLVASGSAFEVSKINAALGKSFLK